MSDKTLEERLSEPGAVYMMPPYNAENVQWLRFFEVALPLTWLAEFASMELEQRMEVAGNEADAMLAEAKKRGRV